MRTTLPLSGRGPAPHAEVTPSVKRTPRENRGSSLPATAAIDNETLDHLLSVVNDTPNVRVIPRMSKQRHLARNHRSFARFPPGNFKPAAGVVAIARRHRERHMRYFFRLTDGTNELNPHEGIDLLGNAAAREEAFKFARQIKMQKADARQELGRLVRPDRRCSTARRSTPCRSMQCRTSRCRKSQAGRFSTVRILTSECSVRCTGHLSAISRSRARCSSLSVAGERDRALDAVDLALFGLALLAILRVDLRVRERDRHALERQLLVLGIEPQRHRRAGAERRRAAGRRAPARSRDRRPRPARRRSAGAGRSTIALLEFSAAGFGDDHRARLRRRSRPPPAPRRDSARPRPPARSRHRPRRCAW